MLTLDGSSNSILLIYWLKHTLRTHSSKHVWVL